MEKSLIAQRKNTAELCPEIRKIGKTLRKKSFYCSQLEKELLALGREAGRYTVLFSEGTLLVGSRVLELDEITDESVIELLKSLSDELYLTNDEFLSLVWQCRFLLLRRAAQAEKIGAVCSLLYAVSDLSPDYIASNSSPLARLFEADETYCRSDGKTQALYRLKTAQTASESGIDEKRLSNEQLLRSRSEKRELGEIIDEDYKRVFRHASTGGYIASCLLPALFLSLLVGLSTDFLCGFLCFFPLLTGTKTLTDIIFSRLTKSPGYLPRLREADKKTAVVLSTLIFDDKSVMDALSRLRQARIRNKGKNILFCLLCDLPGAEGQTVPSDDELIRQLPSLISSSGATPCSVLIRKRSYSKTQRCWQGRERKRGAIEDLVRFMKGEEVDFYALFGNFSELVGSELMIALDSDTLPLLESVEELRRIALHPLNRAYGIIAPRITSSLSSSLRTPFARYLEGNGGTSSVSLYDNASAEFYSSCFDEGIFTGKGLIRTDDFYNKLIGVFPDERVLSHDILEGGILGVAFSGDVEFSESFPPNSKAYFKRLHRWIRGDFQNFRFIFSHKFSSLTKFKLFDNIRRALSPLLCLALIFLSCFYHTPLLLAVSLLCLFAPLLSSLLFCAFDSFGFGFIRRFYSPVVARTKRLLIRLPLEIMLLAYNSLCCADALLKTLLRSVTKRKLLEWTTSSVFDKGSSGFVHLLPSFFLSLVLLGVAVIQGNIPVLAISALMASGLPVLMRCDVEEKPVRPLISANMRSALIKQAEKMWKYYADNCNEENNFLPPDNIQLSPVYREARRTSPTNIGMYLLSCVCVRELGLISDGELFERTEATLDTLLRLEKWRGNLFNWYDTQNLEVISPFVSCVDSGNFLCCLVAVKEELKALGAKGGLVEKTERLISCAELSAFYNERKKLFSIGYDVQKNELSKNHYDMLMSEARMTSYFAIGSGFVGKEHYRALSRIMSRCGKYAGPISWTGTMFEFFMPELLLSSKKGSLSAEALSYALYCQKRRFLPWGISESAYYAFDSELNYQYKAHGVQRLALKGNMNRDCVISPYSSFLALSHDAVSAYNNLCRLEKLGACGKYGFYEALDFTPSRVGKGYAIVKSFMAHHIGMSIIALTNALCDNICPVLFLRDERMERASELLEERVMSGEKIVGTPERREEPPMLCESEKIKAPDACCPRVNILSNSAITLFTSDNGSAFALCGKKDVIKRTEDFIFRPHGEFFSLCCEGRHLPFFSHPMLSDEGTLNVTFSPLETIFERQAHGLDASMTTTLFKNKPAFIHTFCVENLSSYDKTVVFRGFIEPALAYGNELSAHPSFSDLFLRIKKKGDLFIAQRTDRNTARKDFLSVGTIGLHNPSYSLSRESVIKDNNPLSFLTALADNSENEIPSPCVFLYSELTLKKGERREFSVFINCSQTEEELEAVARRIKELRPTPFINPLSRSTLHGVEAAELAAAILYKNHEVNGDSDKAFLKELGISAQSPLILIDSEKDKNRLRSVITAHSLLCLCGLESELVITCREGQRHDLSLLVTELDIISDGHLFIVEGPYEKVCSRLEPFAVATGKPHISNNPPLPFMRCEAPADRERFYAQGSGAYKPLRPYCNVLTNSSFGTLVSDSSLGFSWAYNSHENKLTPWADDLCIDNSGELLLLESEGRLFDIINGSSAYFTPQSADYEGICGDVRTSVSVKVFEKEMGKELTIAVENLSPTEKEIKLSLAVTPSRISKITRDERHITISALSENTFEGSAFVSCNRPFSLCEDRCAFLRGEKSQRKTGAFVAVSVPLKLPPREKEITRYILGWTDRNHPLQQADESRRTGFTPERTLTLFSPDEKLNALFNLWLPWQSLGCRLWARTGFYQNGGAYGFRDQLQDCLSIMYFMPSEVERHILRCCEAQFSEGDVLHWWHELQNKVMGVRTRCSDDMLWLAYTACCYCEMTGNGSFWDKTAVFACAEELSDNENERYSEIEKADTPCSVYEHCKRAMEKGYNKGMLGLLKIGGGDWNDGYNEVGGKDGEGVSVWLSMFYIMCARKFACVSRARGDSVYADELERRTAELIKSVEENAWDGEYYIRAVFSDGQKMGARGNPCCEIDLLPQAFSVLCGLSDRERAKKAVESAIRLLVDKENRLIKLFSPPFSSDSQQKPGYVSHYPEGVRENGGQYTHGAIWLCLACFELGMKEEGFMLLDILNPSKRNEAFRNEPYFMTADIYSNEKCIGMGGWSLYTGAASWYYKAILEGLLGAEFKNGSVSFHPRLPDSFDGTALSIEGDDTAIKVTFRKSKDSNINNETVTLSGNINNFIANF